MVENKTNPLENPTLRRFTTDDIGKALVSWDKKYYLGQFTLWSVTDGVNPICANCGQCKRSYVCSKCKCAHYCDRPCQVADWPKHKNICGSSVIPAKSYAIVVRNSDTKEFVFLAGELHAEKWACRTEMDNTHFMTQINLTRATPTKIAITVPIKVLLRTPGKILCALQHEHLARFACEIHPSELEKNCFTHFVMLSQPDVVEVGSTDGSMSWQSGYEPSELLRQFLHPDLLCHPVDFTWSATPIDPKGCVACTEHPPGFSLPCGHMSLCSECNHKTMSTDDMPREHVTDGKNIWREVRGALCAHCRGRCDLWVPAVPLSELTKGDKV